MDSDDLSLFDEPTEEDLAYKQKRASRWEFAKKTAQESVSEDYTCRTSMENRKLYLMDMERRREVQVLDNVWTAEEVPEIDAYVRQSLHERVITPTAHTRHFLPEHLYFSDLFFVKYEATQGDSETSQNSLGLHTDGSIISFNVLLNPASDFEGGGTYISHLGKTVHIQQGQACVHDGKLEHAGSPVTKGKRFILVGFVQNVRPDTVPKLGKECC